MIIDDIKQKLLNKEKLNEEEATELIRIIN